MEFVLFSSITWDDQGGAHRPTQLARALARLGHRVLFVQAPEYPRGTREHRVELTSLVDLGLTETEIGRLWYGIEEPRLEGVAAALAGRLDRLAGPGPRVAVWSCPVSAFTRLFPLLAAREHVTVYDCIDDFRDAAGMGRFFASPQAEEYLAREADLVLALSPPLVERMAAARPGRPTALVADGADPDFHAASPAPGDLLSGDVTLGFWGTLDDYMVDAAALAAVAQARPGWALNLIGRYDTEPGRPSVAAALAGLPNVRLLGWRPHAQLRHYLAGLDVCLVPFPDNSFSRGRDPIKVYEYLAGYKPVVALNAPQLAGLPFTSVACSADDLIKQIEIAARTRIDHAAVDAFLHANSWQTRAQQIVDLVNQAAPRARWTGGPALLPPFAPPGDDETRRRAYIARLERTAAERRAYALELEAHARDVEQYLAKLERTNPLIRIRRAWQWARRGFKR